METGHLKHFRAAALGASLAGGLLLPCPLPALSGVRGSPTLPPGRSLGSLASALLGGSLRRKTSAHTAVGALLLHQTQTQAHPCSPDVRRPPGSLLLRLQAWKSPGHPSTSGHSPLAHVSGPKGPRRAPATRHTVGGTPKLPPWRSPCVPVSEGESTLSCSESSNCLQVQAQASTDPWSATPPRSPDLPTLLSLLLLHRLLWLFDCPELSPLPLSLRMFCSSSHH